MEDKDKKRIFKEAADIHKKQKDRELNELTGSNKNELALWGAIFLQCYNSYEKELKELTANTFCARVKNIFQSRYDLVNSIKQY
ncbi:MAG: hypothetical protein LBC68_08275 [Prevotellaceae bacterium]|jgi:hypothetical protein|nr:hypothetical protein [Prevotellaceae bacterium]